MTSVRLHADAIAGLLTTAGLTFSFGEANDDAPTPFVVLYPTPGLELAENLGYPIGDLQMDFQLTCVGESAEQALWCSDKARTAINRTIPTVSGRTCWPIWADEQPQPVLRDDAVNPPKFVAISRWSLRSTT